MDLHEVAHHGAGAALEPRLLGDRSRAAATWLAAQAHAPFVWLWRCCVRRGYSGPPVRLHGLRSPAAVSAAARAGELAFPLFTMTIYGLSHYMRWASLARAVGVRIPTRHKALVGASYMLLPNLLVPVLDVRCLHIILVAVVTVNNMYLYREFCIMEQLRTYGRRLPGEPVLIGMWQAANVVHDALEDPAAVLWRKVRRHVPSLLTPGGLLKSHRF